jgi:hypothetical protein
MFLGLAREVSFLRRLNIEKSNIQYLSTKYPPKPVRKIENSFRQH